MSSDDSMVGGCSSGNMLSICRSRRMPRSSFQGPSASQPSCNHYLHSKSRSLKAFVAFLVMIFKHECNVNMGFDCAGTASPTVPHLLVQLPIAGPTARPTFGSLVTPALPALGGSPAILPPAATPADAAPTVAPTAAPIASLTLAPTAAPTLAVTVPPTVVATQPASECIPPAAAPQPGVEAYTTLLLPNDTLTRSCTSSCTKIGVERPAS